MKGKNLISCLKRRAIARAMDLTEKDVDELCVDDFR
jgi:hypothetical protein